VRKSLLRVIFFVLLPQALEAHFQVVTKRILWFGLVWIVLPVPGAPSAAAISGFDSYAASVDARIARQHEWAQGFLAAASLRNGERNIERLTPPDAGLPGALLHHWRGTAFAPGARAGDFERVLRNVNAYPAVFSPQVVRAGITGSQSDRLQTGLQIGFQMSMRLRQKHVITIVMDASYDVSFGRLDAQHRFSTSRSIRISEIESAGLPGERALGPREEHGFLWRLNTWWTCEERDGGLYLQIEAVSLTKSIPPGLAWAMRGYVESIPAESLEFTLRSAVAALRK
jgi:hypothetical protein